MEYQRLKQFYLELETTSRVRDTDPLVKRIQRGVEAIVQNLAQQLKQVDERYVTVGKTADWRPELL